MRVKLKPELLINVSSQASFQLLTRLVKRGVVESVAGAGVGVSVVGGVLGVVDGVVGHGAFLFLAVVFSLVYAEDGSCVCLLDDGVRVFASAGALVLYAARSELALVQGGTHVKRTLTYGVASGWVSRVSLLTTT